MTGREAILADLKEKGSTLQTQIGQNRIPLLKYLDLILSRRKHCVYVARVKTVYQLFGGFVSLWFCLFVCFLSRVMCLLPLTEMWQAAVYQPSKLP